MITACKHTEYEYDGLTVRAEVTTWNGLKFYGKAKCNPEDKYNKNFGERLARARAIDKMINYNCRDTYCAIFQNINSSFTKIIS